MIMNGSILVGHELSGVWNSLVPRDGTSKYIGRRLCLTTVDGMTVIDRDLVNGDPGQVTVDIHYKVDPGPIDPIMDVKEQHEIYDSMKTATRSFSEHQVDTYIWKQIQTMDHIKYSRRVVQFLREGGTWILVNPRKYMYKLVPTGIKPETGFILRMIINPRTDPDWDRPSFRI